MRGSAVVVAATVIQVPAQAGRGVTTTIQPVRERFPIQRAPFRFRGRKRDGNGEQAPTIAPTLHAQCRHFREETPLLLQRFRRQALARKQVAFPPPRAQQPFLRGMQQRGFVVIRRRVVFAVQQQSDIGQQAADVRGFGRRQRQVMRAQWTRQHVVAGRRQVGRGGVAAVFRSLQHHEVAASCARQRPRAGHASHAGAQDRNADALLAARRWQCLAVAQRMAFAHARIRDLRRGLHRAMQPRRSESRRPEQARVPRADQERAPLHQRITRRQSSSK